MESADHDDIEQPTVDQAGALLAGSRDARHRLARTMMLPRGYSLMTGIANAVFVGSIAAGNSGLRLGSVLFVLGLVGMIALQQLAAQRFRRLNGFGIGGHQGGSATWVVLAASAGVLVPAIGVATWLTVHRRAWPAALVALVVIPMTFVADRWWVNRCRAAAAASADAPEPASDAPGSVGPGSDAAR